MLDDAIERGQEIYGKIGADWNDQKKTWRFPGGGRLRFRPLERIADAAKYQGQNLTDACVEEAGNYPDSAPIDRLYGALRSAHGVPAQLILTGNPGGPGQQWLKARYVDPYPSGRKVFERSIAGGRSIKCVYIPSRVQDNKLLLSSDPGYVDRLHLVGSAELVRAWLEGDWTAIEGAFFGEFSYERHVIKPFSIPDHWTRIRAGDWGSARPFCIGWYAVSDGTIRGIPKGAMVKYREWYGSKKDLSGATVPNVGLKMTAEEVAAGIVSRETKDPKMNDSVLDPSAFAQDGGPSIAERMEPVYWRPADNARVARNGAVGGWDQLRARLKGTEEGPLLFFFSTCRDTIRTLPALQHDPQRPEDLDTESEDHAADETRYAVMSRPILHRRIEPEEARWPVERTINEMIAARAA